MSVEPVIIRTKEQLTNMNHVLVNALNNLAKSNKEIPIIYQYLHNPNEEVIVDVDNTIGTARNIIIDGKGDIVCNVKIRDLMKIASNYQGVIDNILATMNPNNNECEVNAFIIYDKFAKQEIMDRKKLMQNNSDLARPGDIPFVSEYGADMLKEVSETLLEEYKKLNKN